MANISTQEQLENLIKLYRSARDKLLDAVINAPGINSKQYANTILQQVQQLLKKLSSASNTYISTALPEEYQVALDKVYDFFKSNSIPMTQPSAFAVIHQDAVYEAAREMEVQIGEGIEQAGRRVIRYIEDARDQALRSAGLEAAGEKFASVSTVRQMKKALIDKLQAQGFLTVQYGEGDNAYEVSLDSYAEMVSRTTTRELTNLATTNQLTANGYDLVEMTEHYPTCSICAPLQGRVYSISGKDKRFPPLSRAFGDYNNVHPHCRHVVTPWIERMHTPKEIEEAIRRSNRSFEDNRSEAERSAYKTEQNRNRRARKDLYQYELYKARLGEDAPKSFSAFRRVKNAGGEKWDELQDKYRAVSAAERKAAKTAERNTHKQVTFDPRTDYSIKIDGYNSTVLSGMSKASLQVAQQGSTDGLEHMVLVDLDNGELAYQEQGDSTSVGGQKFWKFLDDNKTKSFAFVHNHNTDGFLSETDMRTLLRTENVKVMIGTRNDGVKYVAPKDAEIDVPSDFNSLYPAEIKVLNEKYKQGIISAGERTKLREEIIVNNLIRDYVKGFVELDGRTK